MRVSVVATGIDARAVEERQPQSQTSRFGGFSATPISGGGLGGSRSWSATPAPAKADTAPAAPQVVAEPEPIVPVDAPSAAPTDDFMDDELSLGAENMVEPEAEALPEAVEPPVVQATVTPLRSEPAPTAAPAPAAPVERDWIAQATTGPADPLLDADCPPHLSELMREEKRRVGKEW